MFSNPEKNVAQLGLREGMIVADFGSGTGFYARAASARVGHTGKVYAIEVQKELVKSFEDELKKSSLKNIECIWGDIEKVGGTKIAEHTMDAVILSNVLFQVSDKLGLIDEAKRILKSDGKVLVVDWSESFGGMGPQSSDVFTKSKAEEFFSKRGFKFVEYINAGTHHYGIIFKYER